MIHLLCEGDLLHMDISCPCGPPDPLTELLAAHSPFCGHHPDPHCPGHTSPGCHQRKKRQEGCFSFPSHFSSTSPLTWSLGQIQGVSPPLKAALYLPHPTESLLPRPGPKFPLLTDMGAPSVIKKMTDMISWHQGPAGVRPEKSGPW